MKKIPITKAKEISKEYDYDMIIIIGINNDRSGHISTYGKDKNLCKLAGHIGQKELGNYIFNHENPESLLNKLTPEIVK